MRHIYGWVIVGSALIGSTSGADAQVIVSPGNGLFPTQVTVGQPYLNGGYGLNAYGPSQYSGGFVPGYRGPGTVFRGRSAVRPYYAPTRATYPRMGRHHHGGRRHGHARWYRTGYYR